GGGGRGGGGWGGGRCGGGGGGGGRGGGGGGGGGSGRRGGRRGRGGRRRRCGRGGRRRRCGRGGAGARRGRGRRQLGRRRGTRRGGRRRRAGERLGAHRPALLRLVPRVVDGRDGVRVGRQGEQARIRERGGGRRHLRQEDTPPIHVVPLDARAAVGRALPREADLAAADRHGLQPARRRGRRRVGRSRRAGDDRVVRTV